MQNNEHKLCKDKAPYMVLTCEYHALLAVVCLSAVNPDRVCVRNSKLGHREWAISVGIGNWEAK